MAQEEKQRCGICLEDRVPGPPLPESVLFYNNIYEWLPVCSDSGDYCITRATEYHLVRLRERLAVIESWHDNYERALRDR